MKVHIPVKTDDKGGKDMRADLPDFDFIDDIPVDGAQDARIDVDGTASFGDDAPQQSIRTETVYDAAAGVDNVSTPHADGGNVETQTATDAGEATSDDATPTPDNGYAVDDAYDDTASPSEFADIEVDVMDDDDAFAALQEENDRLQRERDDAEDRYDDLLADWQRFRRRAEETREREKAEASAGIATQLLPVLDDLERAIEHSRGNVDDAFVQGNVNIYKRIQSVLANAGVSVIDPLDQPFDMNVQCAIEQKHFDDKPSNIVYRVFQKGYRIDDKVLRPAMVGVTM